MLTDPSFVRPNVPPSRGQSALALGIGIAFALALALLFSFQAAPEPLKLAASQASPKTILAPERITFVSEIQTQAARAKAAAAVLDVYDPPNAVLTREQVRRASQVLDSVDAIRRDPSSSPEQKINWVQALPAVTLPLLTISRTLALDDNAYRRVVTETLSVVDVTMRDSIRPSDVLTEYAKIPSRISLALPGEQADLVAQWSRLFIVPTSFLNQEKTDAARAFAGSAVAPVYRTIEKGQAIVREGEVATPLSLEALDAAGFLSPPWTIADYVAPALIALLLALLLALFILQLRRELIFEWRALLLVAVIVLLFAGGAKLLSSQTLSLYYLYPISAAAMLLAVLVDSATALGAAVALAVAFGFFAQGSFELMFYALAGSLIAALTLGRIERLPAFLWTGLYVAAANAAVVAIFRAADHTTALNTWGSLLAIAVGNGALSGLIALGSLFVFGKIFGVTTSLELLDLGRPTHPLLKKLLLQAPGTYHHSLIVSQLAEQAAQRIGADAMIVRVGAYYHDVGKLAEPQSFVENQLDGINRHDALAPKQSAHIIIEHVARGMALAQRYGLPKRLIEFIPQHHGTTLAAYFHRKALKESSATPIDEKDYRYPGPKPQSREAAILMLADGVEATTRAERPTTPDEIRAVINRIVDERLRDGQLDESNVTLRDLDQIKLAFFDILQGLYHPRVKYPEPEPHPVEQPHDD